jgi:hypothetical protein
MTSVSEAWSLVRDDKSDCHWVIAKPTADRKSIELECHGTSNFDDFAAKMDEVEGIAYGGMRVRAIDDRGALKSVRAKFIKVTKIPDALSVVVKARSAQLTGLVDESMAGTHSSFNVSQLADLSKDDIVKQLQATCGAHRPNGYDFDGATGAESVSSPAAASPVSSGPTSPAPATTVTSVAEADKPNDDKPKPAAVAKPAALEPAAAQGGSLADAWTEVLNDKVATNWALVKIEKRDPKGAVLYRSGTHGLDEMKAALCDDGVFFGGLRVTGIDERGSISSVRSKYVFVQFVGLGVKPMLRAAAGPMKDHFDAIFNGTHATVLSSELGDISPEDIERRLRLSAGAHGPNRYEFGDQITSV